LKQHLEIVATDDGIEIDSSDKHFSNADSPRMAILQPDSNVSCERLLQWLKQDLEIVSTDEGTQMDCREEQSLKADSPRVESREPNSNVKVPRFLQF
jgi:hypothetical protein